jgi:hypothetical protein
MRPKYIEERHPLWFSMCVGERDISDINEIEFARARHSGDAAVLCDRHNEVVRALTDMALAWHKRDPEGFKEYWYGQEG